MARQKDPEQRDFEAMVEALEESFVEFMANDGERPTYLPIMEDQQAQIVRFRNKLGQRGLMPLADFQEMQECVGDNCLVCLDGQIHLEAIARNRGAAMRLVCSRCAAQHRLANGDLCVAGD